MNFQSLEKPLIIPFSQEVQLQSGKGEVDLRVAQVSKKTLTAFGALLCSAAYVACTFYAFSISATLLTGVVISALMEGTIALLQNVQGEKMDLKRLGSAALSIGRVNVVGLADVGGIGIGAHELGHAAVIKACIQNSSPIIKITPFVSGSTSFKYIGALTTFGKWLGERSVFILIASGGILSTITVSLFCFGVGEALKKSHPKLSQFFTSFGITRSANEVHYGMSSYKREARTLSHDFVYLSRIGKIPAYIPIVILVSVLTVGIYNYMDQRLKEPRA